jgi:hypothetical protein
MILHNLELLPINQKNSYGRYYDLEAAEKIIREYERQVKRLGHFYGCYDLCQDYCDYGDPDIINIKNIGFTVDDLKLDGINCLSFTVNILETPKGKQLKESIRDVVFRPSVWGFVKNDGKVIVERLIGINSFNRYHDTFIDKHNT